jgi:hypothetical protein
MIAGDIGFVEGDYCRFFVPRIYLEHGLQWIARTCLDGSQVTRIILRTRMATNYTDYTDYFYH